MDSKIVDKVLADAVVEEHWGATPDETPTPLLIRELVSRGYVVEIKKPAFDERKFN